MEKIFTWIFSSSTKMGFSTEWNEVSVDFYWWFRISNMILLFNIFFLFGSIEINWIDFLCVWIDCHWGNWVVEYFHSAIKFQISIAMEIIRYQNFNVKKFEEKKNVGFLNKKIVWIWNGNHVKINPTFFQLNTVSFIVLWRPFKKKQKTIAPLWSQFFKAIIIRILLYV